MNRFALAVWILCCALPVCAEDPSPKGMQAYLNPGKKDISDTVWQMLNEAGQTVGFQGGKAQRAGELRQRLIVRDDVLNDMYDFRPLISRQGYLPPVITTAADLAHVTPNQLRTSFRTFNIIVPARFVSNPPGWRAWLLAGLPDNAVEASDISIRPKNRKEQAVWEDAIRRGWQEGRLSADRTLETNFSRLTRDYTGMLRYSTLLQQGMTLAPDVREQQQTVTGSRDELMIGDKVKRIYAPAGFIVDKKQWKPVIRKESQ